MAGNSFGQIFRITTFGESHGKAIGVVIDGCPAGLQIDLDLVQHELDRRKPGRFDELEQARSGTGRGLGVRLEITLLLRLRHHVAEIDMRGLARPCDRAHDIGVDPSRGAAAAGGEESAGVGKGGHE